MKNKHRGSSFDDFLKKEGIFEECIAMNISFKILQKHHFPLLLKWLNSPHVQQFWDTGTQWTEELIEEKYGTYVQGYKLVNGVKKKMSAFIILWDERPVGYVQYYDAWDFPRDGYDLEEVLKGTLFERMKLAALDIFIGEEDAIGKGVGVKAMQELLEKHILTEFEGCLVDPDLANVSAIRAYEKAGFKRKDVNGSMIMIKLKGH
jgi:aminoglycoside 6'-N-acetyltransferase